MICCELRALVLAALRDLHLEPHSLVAPPEEPEPARPGAPRATERSIVGRFALQLGLCTELGTAGADLWWFPRPGSPALGTHGAGRPWSQRWSVADHSPGCPLPR